ncbi:type III-B CRISPR-associated protein Cas10/Cmr2 [Paenibacillus sp. SYP-B4298]|uniref:type III-B CRISPR-associated protein Cas10/Cmr2 n=1 Tax=Paenibacillus sp. SYP-B4298 TaxID=2996034 RepID=UPI0022DDAE20|nr:type III-B CRISPR-associated protein Cas10/Cmr2 [Paenibacillus sp. SYP-B4298]
MTNEQYAIFGIGPVQSFIAASRKLEDLWGGSYLLSFLIKQAITHLDKISKESGMGYTLIYPHYDVNGQRNMAHEKSRNKGLIAVANFPNRITFTLQCDATQARKVMTALEQKVREELKRIALWVVERVFNDETSGAQQRVAELQRQACQQMDEFLEVHWIAYPSLEDNYRIQAERCFHALKGQKMITTSHETGLACTLYQRMDALCYDAPLSTDRYGTLKWKLHETWKTRNTIFKPKTLQEADQDNARIRDNEFLSGISLVRRVARDYFQAENSGTSEAFSKYETVLNIGSVDEKYYAVLLMDGDNMGQFFNRGVAEVCQTSENLSEFAMEKVPAIVSGHDGVLLYAGGDDVLALFPIQKVLSAAYELREAFSDKLGEGATASTGIAIGHKKTPLQQMLQQARSLEKVAKSYRERGYDKPTKNAFALSVLPRSGEYLGPIVLPWSLSSGAVKKNVTEQLGALSKSLSNVVSKSFIYHFASTFQGMAEAEQNPPLYLKEMAQQEFKRLYTRSLRDPISSEHSYEHCALPSIEFYLNLLSLKEFIDLLKILAFFSRKGK